MAPDFADQRSRILTTKHESGELAPQDYFFSSIGFSQTRLKLAGH